MSLQVIKASYEDIKCIQGMAEVVFRHTYRDILSPEQMEYMMEWMYSPANLKCQFDEGHVYFIAVRDSIPSGYVSVQSDGISCDGRMLFHLHKIYVLPSEQGSGLGRVLYETVLSYIRQETDGRPAALELNVNRNNPSIGFYKHMGLRVLRQGDFHIGHGFYMNDYIMGIDID